MLANVEQAAIGEFSAINRLMEAARFVAKYDKIPDTVKELTYELIMPEVVEALIGPDALALAGGRISKANFNRLLNGQRTDLEKIHNALKDQARQCHDEVVTENRARIGQMVARAGGTRALAMK